MTWTTVWVTVVAATALVAAGAGVGVGASGVPGGRARVAEVAEVSARGVAESVAPAAAVSRAGPVGAVASAGTGCAGPAGPGARCWPVTGPGARGRPEVLRAFDPPARPWEAGHRGVDLRASPGAAVRAAVAGEVSFAGLVGGAPVVVVRLAGGLRVTYEPVRAVLPVGTRVEAGAVVGRVKGGLAHCGGDGCLHWGLLRADVYLDPLTLLPPFLRRAGPSRLLPVYAAARR